jgi:hypothetical protein
MMWRLSIVAALSLAFPIWAHAQGNTPTPAAAPVASKPPVMQSPPPLPSNSLAPYEVRLANAKSVKVMTSILGITLGSRLEHAHEILDKLCDAAHRPKEEKEEEEAEGEQKVLWELSKSPYAFVFVKADDKEKITYISGFLRKGKEIPFEKIGETKKAPLQDQNTIAWDVLRMKQAPFRVVASGLNRKANNVIIFVVKRPSPFHNR